MEEEKAKGGNIYEIYGYQTSSEYEGRNPSYLDEGITSKKQARSLAKNYLDEYYIVKVQSMNRDAEYIEVFGGEDR